MAFSIDQLKSKISQKGGIALADLFEVKLPAIPGFDGIDELNVLCKDVNIPGRQITSNDRLIGMHLEKVAYGYAVADVSATFLCLNGFYVRKYFEAWQALAVNPETFELGYSHGPNGYAKDVSIYQLSKNSEMTEENNMGFLQPDADSKKVYGVKLEYAYPTTLNGIGYANENQNIVEINVQLSYRNWKPIEL